MADETPEDERFTPTTGLPIEQAPDYTDLPTQGVEDPAYGAAVRGEEPEEVDEGNQDGPDVPRWPFGIGSLNPDTGKLEPADELTSEDSALLDPEKRAEMERLLQEAREKMARTPDGVEGELSAAGEDPQLEEMLATMAAMGPGAQMISDDDFLTAARLGVGRAAAVDEDGDPLDLIAVVMEVDPPADTDLPIMRVVRTLDPAQAAKLARDLLNQVLDRVAGPPAPQEPPVASAAGEPDAPAALDTEE